MQLRKEVQVALYVGFRKFLVGSIETLITSDVECTVYVEVKVAALK